MKTLPKGCDQQGRYPEAAEAATEIGIEEPEHDMLRMVIDDTLWAMAALIVVAVIVLIVWGSA
jgi:hypothetical protein